MRMGSLVFLGGGISVSALHGERLSGNISNREVSGWALQIPFVVELGFPNVEWGRFSVGAELGAIHAAAPNTYCSEERSTYTHGGFLLGLRIGYVHWLSDRMGLLVNAGIRASLASDSIYAALVTRVGVSWRL